MTVSTGIPGAVAAGELAVTGAWARASLGTAKSGAVYLTVENRGAAADRLIAAETPAASRAALHTHIMEEGVMKMRPVEGGIEIPAGGSAVLAPGGLHVMLMGLAAPLEEGARFPLTLTFEQAGPVTVEVLVRPATAMDAGG
ncbi:MAG: copper chaperone PCu(A)C [Rhodospirillales bacterium]|nr:copper chaperone PCu(A)C [Rhodospirillales bacterium]